MPRLAQTVPKYRKHKASGQAIVELNGRRHYLGPHGSKISRDEYDRLIGEWLQNGRFARPSHAETSGTLVVELVAAYLKFAKSYYRKAGRLTSEYSATLIAMRPLTQLYGRRRAVEFGPIALQSVVARMWAKPGYNIVVSAYTESLQDPFPECALDYPSQVMRRLIGLCYKLSQRHADARGVWFLSCRSAAEVLGVEHTTAAKLLKMLVRDGVLEVAEPGTTRKAARYRYLGD